MSKFKYHKRSPYELFLRLLEPDIILYTLDPSIYPIGQAISKCIDVINDASLAEIEYGDMIVDEETDIIENLLGTSFILSQTYISGVVSRVKGLHAFFKKRERRSISNLSSDKKDILIFGGETISSMEKEVTDIQVIEAFANYFKHRDEWSQDWSRLSEKQKKAADVIQSFNASSGSSGNLRVGSKVLGNTDYKSVGIFTERLKSWGVNIKKAYSDQLLTEGVL